MERFVLISLRLSRAREFKRLKQRSMMVDECDAKFNWLLRYAPYMVHDEREKIRRFILGLQYPLYQLVGTQMETFPNYLAMVENARMMELGKQKGRDFLEEIQERI